MWCQNTCVGRAEGDTWRWWWGGNVFWDKKGQAGKAALPCTPGGATCPAAVRAEGEQRPEPPSLLETEEGRGAGWQCGAGPSRGRLLSGERTQKIR